MNSAFVPLLEGDKTERGKRVQHFDKIKYGHGRLKAQVCYGENSNVSYWRRVRSNSLCLSLVEERKGLIG